MSFPTNDGPPILMPRQFDELLTKAIDAHDTAMASKSPTDWKKAEALLEQARGEYERVFNTLNQAVIEDLRR